MKKFYEFKNITPSTADLFIYGAIVSEHDDWFGSDSDVSLTDFKEEIDSLGNIKTLNIFINSPGGDVFAASTMISLLQRLKEKGTKLISYVDGLSASAASFLMMVADEIKLYKNSIVMIHKPMSFSYGNANEMQKTIDTLNKIEDSVMIPMYMNKSKVSEDEIRNIIDAESWLNANDMAEKFNVTLLDEEKTAVASVSSNLFKNYKNIPDFIKNSLENEEKGQEIEENAEKSEEIEQKEQIQEEISPEISENESISTENQSKEEEIKARLSLINISLKLKTLEEGEDKNE